MSTTNTAHNEINQSNHVNAGNRPGRPSKQGEEDLKLIGFQASEEFRLRLKIAAARRGKSMREALHDAVELWIQNTENDVLFDEETIIKGAEANRIARAQSRKGEDRLDDIHTEDADDIEFDDDDDDIDAFLDDVDEEGLQHGDDLIVDDTDK